MEILLINLNFSPLNVKKVLTIWRLNSKSDTYIVGQLSMQLIFHTVNFSKDVFIVQSVITD